MISRIATFFGAVLLAGFATAPLIAQNAQPTPPQSAKPVIELRGGKWFDGKGYAKAQWFVVEGRFTATRPSRVDAVIDLRDRYIFPPLAEAHNHNLQSPWTAGAFAPQYLKQGVFYSAQLGANAPETASFAGLLRGPGAVDVLFTDTLVSASDGHPLKLALDGAEQAGMKVSAEEVRAKFYTSVDTLAEWEAKWPAIAAAQPRLIKAVLIDSGNFAARRGKPERFGVNGLDPALIPAIVTSAHAAGARVAVHVDTAHDAKVAVDSGADMIAHLPGYMFDKSLTKSDYRLSDATIAEAARRKMTWITTVAASRYFLKAHPAQRAAVMANHADNLRRLRKAGVSLALGSDVFEGSVIDEIEAIDALAVMSRAQLLALATRDSAKAIFPAREIGCLCEGAEASLIALDRNPLDDPAALRSIGLAIKQGELLAR